MTPATLTAPAAPEAPPPEAKLRVAVSVIVPRAPLTRSPRRDPTGRPTRNALLASVALHLLLALAFLLAPARRERTDPALQPRTLELVQYLDVGEWPESAGEGAAAPASAPGAAAAEQAVSAAAVDSAVARVGSVPRFPDRVPSGIPAAPAAPSGGAARPGAAAPGAGGGAGGEIGNNPAGGRLGPGYRDGRLIVRPEAVPERELTEHERYMRDLAGRIQTYNDSVADEGERMRRARNWTTKDKNGREWGIAEGGYPVIAGRRIPVPIAPPIHVDRDTENRERAQARQRDEIQRQAEAGDRDRNFRERTRAIRERRDRERQKEREQSGQGERPPESKP
ncbi:MAG TPA: hypothetical protein VF746_26470 [Longimicrobium sp.]